MSLWLHLVGLCGAELMELFLLLPGCIHGKVFLVFGALYSVQPAPAVWPPLKPGQNSSVSVVVTAACSVHERVQQLTVWQSACVCVWGGSCASLQTVLLPGNGGTAAQACALSRMRLKTATFLQEPESVLLLSTTPWYYSLGTTEQGCVGGTYRTTGLEVVYCARVGQWQTLVCVQLSALGDCMLASTSHWVACGRWLAG